MPLPLVHMCITERIFKQKGMEVNPQFLLGSISPDAIHMRENSTREDKNKTHFDIKEDYTVNDFFQYKMRPFIDECLEDNQWTMFAKGYVSHVLTDLIWTHTIYADFKQETASQQIEDIRTLYYAETDQIDFNLFRKEPWRPQAWEGLQNCPPVFVPNLLTKEEVEKWKQRILDWHTHPEKEPCIEPKFITEKNVRIFIQDASSQLINLFEQAEYF
ncbi:zinc dependent phospholipase C family protein [Paenibacillus sp. LHD-117]|uniref:zinc dependent phospholipase C family protein n=1 Tax=Paenibacillus sp. LHD-117 TaxID=3071412 RepID=UPI0027DEE91E|nr:zinc dependent phospholipase C family protein [Paenibacillus sp. LHD-117]MDQ6420474.1 zinc dependent phospholipase C family protein [Paenibacillus sp. LHD-117]